MSRQIQWILIVVLLGGAPLTVKAQCTGEVYAANATLKGLFKNAVGTVLNATATQATFVNIALGLNRNDSPIPTNMVLAVVSNCHCSKHSLWLVVWDKNAKQIAAVIAKAVDVLGDGNYFHAADTAKTGTSTMLLSVQSAGNFNGGFLSLVASYSIPTAGCLNKITATVTGDLNLNSWDHSNNWIDGIDLLVLGGTIGAKAPLLGTAPMN